MSVQENTVQNEICEILNNELIIIDEPTNKDGSKKKHKKPKCVYTAPKKKIQNVELTYENYFHYKVDLTKYKIPELKECCKKNKLYVTGKKQVLIDRIETLFKNTKAAIIVQKYTRRFIILVWYKKKGPAIKDRSLCNNNTDFITLEPVNEISFYHFFSYTDSNNFTYGFDIISLIHNYAQYGKVKNPYNREKLSKRILNKIKSVFIITGLFDDTFKKYNEKYSIIKPTVISRRDNRLQNSIRINTENYNYTPRLNPNAFTLNENRIRWNRIQEIRSRPIQERVENLFIEIDLLGNYTQSSWFNNLSYNAFVRFYRYLNDIWSYRSGMSHLTKMQICPFYNPFDGIFPNRIELNYEIMKLGCLIVFENFVYCGINDEFRQIGTLHALSSLTLVSEPARQSFPYLYESVSFT